jgi:hypothetical protein
LVKYGDKHKTSSREARGPQSGISRRSLLVGASAAALTTMMGTPFNSVSGSSPWPGSDLKVLIHARNVKRNFLRTLLGEGLIMGFGYMWDAKNRRMWPGLMEKIIALKSDFFGHFGGPGIWVHDYHWKNVIGPMERRLNVGRLTGVEYARRVRAFTAAMKQRDPSIKVTGYLPFFAFDGSVEEALKIGTAIEDVPGEPGSTGPTWTRLILQEAGDILDALDYHWYGAVNSRAVSYEFIMSSAFKGLLPNIERARAMVRQYAPTDEARERLSTFVCPEYGGLSNNGPIAETATAVFGAVAASRLLHLFFSLDDLRYAARFGLFAPYPEPRMPYEMRTPYAAIHGRADGSDFMGTAMYEMNRLWAMAHQPKIVAADVTGAPTFSTGVSVLDVTAMVSEDGQALSLVLTNTGQKEIRPNIAVQDFKPALRARHLLVGGDLNDDNRWEKRSKVVIRQDEIRTDADFTLPLPPHSITAVMMKQE